MVGIMTRPIFDTQVQAASEVIDVDAKNVKGWYRRGLGLMKMGKLVQKRFRTYENG